MTLITEQVYRRISKDLTSQPGDVTAALADAQQEVEERLYRKLEYGTYTDRLQIHDLFVVYPLVTPIDPATVGYIDPSSMYAIGSDPSDPLAPYTSTGQPVALYTFVTYQGGFTSATLPYKLKRAICLLAKAQLVGDDMPSGLKSYSFGDLSMTFDEPTNDWPPGLWRSIRGYAKRQVSPV